MRTAWSSRPPWPGLPKRSDSDVGCREVAHFFSCRVKCGGGFKAVAPVTDSAIRLARSSKTLHHHLVGIGLLADPKRGLAIARKTETFIEGDGVLILAVDREPHAVKSALRP